VKLSDLLGPEQTLIDLRANNKAQLLQELSRRAAAAIGIDEAHIFEVLQARENLGSTGLGKGFALPHARLESVRASPSEALKDSRKTAGLLWVATRSPRAVQPCLWTVKLCSVRRVNYYVMEPFGTGEL
jgi:Phosphoenolpyruvate-dependent sugar phosphotransferase system, EIIA 2